LAKLKGRPASLKAFCEFHATKGIAGATHATASGWPVMVKRTLTGCVEFLGPVSHTIAPLAVGVRAAEVRAKKNRHEQPVRAFHGGDFIAF